MSFVGCGFTFDQNTRIKNLAQFTVLEDVPHPPPTSEPGKNDDHLERRRNKEIYDPILSVGIRGEIEIANLLRALGFVGSVASLCSLQSTT